VPPVTSESPDLIALGKSIGGGLRWRRSEVRVFALEVFTRFLDAVIDPSRIDDGDDLRL
jgi:hypothetical protein